MLVIKANKSIYFDGDKLDLGEGSMKNFLLASLNCPIVLDEELTIGDFIHILYDISDFITLYCGEEYEVGRALIIGSKMNQRYDYLNIFKNAEVTTDGFLKINCQSDLCSYNENGKIQSICNLRMKLDQNIVDGDSVLRENIILKADFTLIELISVIYEDFIFSLKQDNVII